MPLNADTPSKIKLNKDTFAKFRLFSLSEKTTLTTMGFFMN